MDCRRTLNKNGLYAFTAAQKPSLRPEHVQARLKLAGDKEGARWRDVIYTDEAAVVFDDKKGKPCAQPFFYWQICTDHGLRGVIRPMGERFSVPNTSNPNSTLLAHPSSFGAELAITTSSRWSSSQSPKPLKFNGERYLEEILGPVLSVEIAQMVMEGKKPLVEDGSRILFKRTILPSKSLLGIENLTHPAASPDLNSIENMWAIMKNALRKRKTKATSKEELWRRIQEEWDAIPIARVNNIIDTMEER